MSEQVFLSVIIPTFNRNQQLASCLDKLSAENQFGVNAGYEVIVSDDSLTANAQALIQQQYPWVRWTAGPGRGPAANRNCGAKLANGQWLVFIDDDCLPESNWLAMLAKAAGTDLYDVVEGKTLSAESGDNAFKYYVENLNGGNYWSCNLAVRRELFDRLGGFDEDFQEAGGEDMEFAYRLKKASAGRRAFVSEAIVLHPARWLTPKFLLWRTRLIRWKVLYDIKTGAVPPDYGHGQAALVLIESNISDLLRTTWHLFNRPNSRRRHSNFFQQLWKWITFPFSLPYQLLWQMRFRQKQKL